MKKHIWKKSFFISLIFHSVVIIAIGAMVAGFYQNIQRPKEELITVNLADTPEQIAKNQVEKSIFSNPVNDIFNSNDNDIKDKNIEKAKDQIVDKNSTNEAKHTLSVDEGILPNTNNRGFSSNKNEDVGGSLENTTNNKTTGAINENSSGNGERNSENNTTSTTEDRYSVASRFAQAVEANKSYPYIAVRLNQQGTVIVNVIIDKNGNLISANVVTNVNSNLDKAALNAVYNACPFTHKLGESISMNVPVNFYLN